MHTKVFSPSLYEQNDERAKKAIEEILGTSFLKVIRPSDRYTVDLFVYREEKYVGNIETEIKHGWQGDDYPFPDVRFPYRKKKFTDLEKPTVFVMFNKDLSRHLGVLDKDLLSSPVHKVDNKELRDEAFFVVPLPKVRFDWLYRW